MIRVSGSGSPYALDLTEASHQTEAPLSGSSEIWCFEPVASAVLVTPTTELPRLSHVHIQHIRGTSKHMSRDERDH